MFAFLLTLLILDALLLSVVVLLQAGNQHRRQLRIVFHDKNAGKGLVRAHECTSASSRSCTS